MQTKPSKNTRGRNAEETRYHTWAKEQPCAVCGIEGPSILHHCFGQTFKHNKVLVGHWFVIPLCPICDDADTNGSHKAFRERFGPQCDLWAKTVALSPYQPPDDVYMAIMDWGK